MIVVVDDRASVADGYVALFRREGVAACVMASRDLHDWLISVSDLDLVAVEAFIVGEVANRSAHCQLISTRTRAVLIATKEVLSLEETLALFSAGVDDVVRKPIHVREILARISAVTRRRNVTAEPICLGEIRVFGDGRDPVVGGEVLPLPRRERRILEFLLSKASCRVSKAQIFHCVYGLFDDHIDENVIESHISKLRKRLRQRLGYDPIDSKRFLGYRLVVKSVERVKSAEREDASFTQADYDLPVTQH
jgi:DNA-binding response OmpR family regulator